MSLIPNLRVAKERSEIVEVLTKIYIKGTPILIWQKENEKKRLLNTAKISHIDTNIGVFYLKSTSGTWVTGIKGELSLYFKGEEESILFKAKNLIVQKTELIVPIPAEVRLIEKRDQPRMHLDPKNPNNKFLIQKIFENGIRKNFHVTVLDVSITGAALRISKSEGKFFYEKDTLYVTQVGHTGLKESIQGKVVYLKPIEYVQEGITQKGFRVGVQFSRYLTSDHLNLFNKS